MMTINYSNDIDQVFLEEKHWMSDNFDEWFEKI